MHEFAVAKQILNHVEKYAEAHNAKKVTDVYLVVGNLRGMVNEWVTRYFAYASKGTVVEGANVHIHNTQGSLLCIQCNNIMYLGPDHMPTSCEKCGSKEIQLRSGMEFRIIGITIEENVS